MEISQFGKCTEFSVFNALASPDAVSSGEDPLVGDQCATTGVVEVTATLVLQRNLRRNKQRMKLERFKEAHRGHRICISLWKGSYLPGPAVLTHIFSADHPADNGRVGGSATPVGWEVSKYGDL